MHYRVRSHARKLWLVVATIIALLACPLAAIAADVMLPNEQLASGAFLTSGDNRIRLMMQTDGNLVLYHDNIARWATGTLEAGARAVMQSDGNLVIYSAAGKALWSSGTSGRPGASLVLQGDGNLVIYDATTRPVWSSNTLVRLSLLEAGQTLRPGEVITAEDSDHYLQLRTTGELVVANSANGVVWSSGTGGSQGAALTMQQDGNAVLYSASGKVLWSSNTAGNPGAFLQLQADGNLVVYSRTDNPLWSADSFIAPTTLKAGERLVPGTRLRSQNGAHLAVFQQDGNFVVYGPEGARWSSGTANRGHSLILQADGNLVIYDQTGRAVWSSGTAGNTGGWLSMQNDGNLVVYNTAAKPLWSIGTFIPRGDVRRCASVYGPVGEDQTTMASGFLVHKCLANSVNALVPTAVAAGFTLTGSAWRSHQAQINLRIKNCGGNTYYNIYEKPSSRCSPQTAIPGNSMHERGLAIDFDLPPRGTAARDAKVKWLKKNTPSFGLYNLPGEDWHYSTNGR